MWTSHQTWDGEPSVSSHRHTPLLAAVLPPATPDAADGDAFAPSLRVQLVYEDAETGLRARQTLEHLVPGLRNSADLELGLWRFDVLNDPGLRELAKSELAEADILFLSAHGRSNLPAYVRSHLTHWLARRSAEPRALVVSLDAADEASVSAHQLLASLRDWGAFAGVEVITHLAQTGAISGKGVRASSANGAATQSNGFEGLLISVDSYPHWGINE